MLVKDKLWYQNLPKIPFLISSPLQGPGGSLSRATCRAGVRLRPALPTPSLPPPPLPTSLFTSSKIRDLKCQSRGPAPSSCYKPIILVSMVTASSPWLHTNCHGHSVALPTALAVGHMRVRATISPIQAWGHVTWWEEMEFLPAAVHLQPPAQPSPFYCALLRARRDDVRRSKTRGTASLRGEEAKRSALPF